MFLNKKIQLNTIITIKKTFFSINSIGPLPPNLIKNPKYCNLEDINQIIKNNIKVLLYLFYFIDISTNCKWYSYSNC